MRSLALKLTLAFLFVGLMGAMLVALFVGQRTQQAFDQFVLNRYQVDLVAELAEYYQTNGTWDGIRGILVRNAGGRPGWWDARWAPVALVDANGKVVYGGGRHPAGEQITALDRGRSVPIEANGTTVGWLLFDALGDRRPPLPGSPESAFLARVSRATTYGALGATAIALVLGVLLARTISRPVRELTAATQIVSQGELGHQVPVRTRDELGELAASFNQMSADLARSNQLRRQMTADIAHELRTPLSVILGYTEALNDGKLQGTPETFDVMHDQAQRLSRLIDDLRTLSLADASELPLAPRSVDPRALMERAASAYKARAQQKGVSLQVEATPELPEIEVDPDRMAQVLGNLLSNALRYTPAGGQISLQSSISSNQYPVSSIQSAPAGKQTAAPGKLITDHCLLITVRDTGAGIPPEDLPHIFDRFYRGDKSRSQREGESGLGLAIAKSLVEMQGGTITVDSTLGEGTAFTIRLPLLS